MAKISVWDRRTWGAVRQVKGLTYREIAEDSRVDCYPGTVEKWFNGERNPKLKYQLALAKILGIPLRSIVAEIKDPAIRAVIRAAYND